MVLDGTNTFEGRAFLSAGILVLDNAQALGGAPLNGGAGTVVENGATIQLEGGITYVIEPLTINGAGVNGTMGALESVSGSNVWSGPIKLGSATTITSDAGSTFIDHVQIANEGYMFTVNAVGNVDLDTSISGAGGLTKDGTGTLTLSSADPNLYTGPTIVNAGTLLLSKPSASQALSGSGVTINPGATLAGTGLIATSVSNDGVLSPGSSSTLGSLIIEGGYTQGADGTLDMAVVSTKSLDQLMITGAASLNGTLNVTFLNGFQPMAGSRIPLLNFGSPLRRLLECQFATFRQSHHAVAPVRVQTTCQQRPWPTTPANRSALPFSSPGSA